MPRASEGPPRRAGPLLVSIKRLSNHLNFLINLFRFYIGDRLPAHVGQYATRERAPDGNPSRTRHHPLSWRRIYVRI